MQKRKVLELPFASTAAVGGPVLATAGGDLLLSMDFDDEGKQRSACLRFVKRRAFRERSEIYCTAWHVTDTFDTVCEVQGSDWVHELRSASVPEWSDYWVMRHFMIYIDSFGCIEVIAESVVFDDDAKNFGGT
ncbi:MAG: hypothetical protein ACOYO0_06635 [Sandarakinorhabdus sp.]